ncbi:MAG: hypothetical protein LBE36_08980 [Flavobacteriaceae bacterium]|jgi:hypothetical protein|nr:hypothetical protein [Flavobacteriaceae bacterium]
MIRAGAGENINLKFITMQKKLLFLFVLLVSYGCSQQTLQENSLIENTTIMTTDSLPKNKELNDAELLLIGHRFIPHVAFINITFYEDRTFYSMIIILNRVKRKY